MTPIGTQGDESESFESIRRELVAAVDAIYENDPELMHHQLYEGAISHRLAVYLEERFGPLGYRVDCEYDKFLDPELDGNFDGTKWLDRDELRSNVRNCAPLIVRSADEEPIEVSSAIAICGSDKEDLKREVRPDIIVHRRALSTDNHLIIEVKKYPYRGKIGAVLFDFAKLVGYTSDDKFAYRHGLFLQFGAEALHQAWHITSSQSYRRLDPTTLKPI